MSGDKRLYDVARQTFGSSTSVPKSQQNKTVQQVQQSQTVIPQKDKRVKNSTIKTLSDFANASVQEQKAFIDSIKHISLPQGYEDSLTQRLNLALQFNKPAMAELSDSDFEGYQKLTNAEVWYRVPYGARTAQSKDFVTTEMTESAKDAHFFGGAARHGSGLYFAQDSEEYAWGSSTHQYRAMLSPSAKVLNFENWSGSKTRTEYENWAKSVGVQPNNKNISLYALSKGYDAIRSIGGNHGQKGAGKMDYLVPVNRSVLIYNSSNYRKIKK